MSDKGIDQALSLLVEREGFIVNFSDDPLTFKYDNRLRTLVPRQRYRGQHVLCTHAEKKLKDRGVVYLRDDEAETHAEKRSLANRIQALETRRKNEEWFIANHEAARRPILPSQDQRPAIVVELSRLRSRFVDLGGVADDGIEIPVIPQASEDMRATLEKRRGRGRPRKTRAVEEQPEA